MARNFNRQKFLVIVIFATLASLAWLFYRYRESDLIRKLTDNPVNLREINRLAKVSNLLFLTSQLKPEPNLPQYQLNVLPKNIIKLRSNLPDINNSVLIDNFAHKVPAEFIAENKVYPVEVQYRGNGAVHWAYVKKSWRVKFLDEQFQKLSSIDFIVPEDRGLSLEHLANFRAQKLGLLSPDSWFAQLSLNGGSPMIYFVTEKIDEDFIKRRQLEGTLFSEKDNPTNWNQNIYLSADNWRTYPDNQNQTDFHKLQQLLDVINSSTSTTAEIGALLDLDNFIRWHIHSLLMASVHQDQSHNNRLFFNHSTGLFSFIPWDTGQREMVSESLNPQVHPVVKRLIADPQIVKTRNELLKSYLTDADFLRADQDYFQLSQEQVWIPLVKDVNKFYPTLKYYLDSKNNQQWHQNHFNNLFQQLPAL